jgi:hypothetical protein
VRIGQAVVQSSWYRLEGANPVVARGRMLRLWTPDDAHIALVLTEDETRRIASNIAKLPSLIGKASQC